MQLGKSSNSTGTTEEVEISIEQFCLSSKCIDIIGTRGAVPILLHPPTDSQTCLQAAHRIF